jgi:hypothetical protein
VNAVLAAVQWGCVLLFGLLWFQVGWTDFKRQKILGTHLRRGAAAVLAAYGVLFLLTVLGLANLVSVYPHWNFYKAAFMNVALCGGAAIALWWFGVWPAGDAKLFMLVGGMYPLTCLNADMDSRRLFLVALTNTFLPACAAVFLRAAQYVYATRLAHRRQFLQQLGWRREADFLASGVTTAIRAVVARGAGHVKSVSLENFDLRARIISAGDWLLNLAAMSLLSYAMKDFFRSPILFSVLWGGAMLARARFAPGLGGGAVRLALLAGSGLFLYFTPHDRWPQIWTIFKSLSLFSVFFYFGVKWAAGLAIGDLASAYVMTLIVPLVAVALGLAASWLGIGWHGSGARNALVLCAMGVFFGLTLVLVRLWDHEVEPRALQDLSAFAVLSPAFVDTLRQDESFFEEHFGRLYADGLTLEQAAAVQDWCARKGIKAVQLTPTISFASWIFFGYFLSRLLGGGTVLAVIF